MLRKLITALLLLACTFCFPQLGPRAWQDHLSINYCNTVTKLGSKIYASNYNGLVCFDESEVSPKRLTKINGLSDVGIRLVRANPYNRKLLVVYENCNLDVIDEEIAVSNYPDFKLKTMSAKKIINEVTFYKQFAYLACGFGIVVFDTEKLEIRDTYIIGLQASNLEVLQIALTDSLIFAATARGMYRSNHLLKSLNNFRSWSADTLALPRGIYLGVLNVQGTIISLYSHFRTTGEKDRDTFYIYQHYGKWIKYPPLANFGYSIMKIGPVQDSVFASLNQLGAAFVNIRDGSNKMYINSFNGEVDYGTLRDAYMGRDHTGAYSYWIADARFGLYQTYGYHPFSVQNKVSLNGMDRYFISRIDLFEGMLAVAPSNVANTGNQPYITNGINILEKDEWSYLPVINTDGKAALDITSVLIDRKDKTRLWASSFNSGIYEFRNKKLHATYNQTNAAVPELESVHETRSNGLAMDKDGNLWFANSEQSDFLSVLRRNQKQVLTYNFDAARFVRKIFIDKNNYIWILHEREGGITIFRHNNFAASTYKVLSNEVGKGNLQSNAVYAIAEDKDGKIWVGTYKGISVFYNPSAIFGSGDFDSQPIKIVQDGNVELLLGNEIVTSIAVDGANNKWVGTNTGGVYCFSPDGVKQIYHFTKENSPLYSNNIVDVSYDEVTGDVFIGSELGLQSFRSTIIEGAETYSEAHAFPNPVKPGYQGTVLVRGLIDNSIIKITDTAGYLVWETKSTGGQVEWPLRDLAGNKVNSGVYLVYASTGDGSVKTVTKVLVMN